MSKASLPISPRVHKTVSIRSSIFLHLVWDSPIRVRALKNNRFQQRIYFFFAAAISPAGVAEGLDMWNKKKVVPTLAVVAGVFFYNPSAFCLA